jgi:chloramphenicol-sensitive protein RarD
MPISALGLMNYLAPCLQFLIAIFLYDESFGVDYLITFGFIWAALAFYSIDLVRTYGRRPRAEAMR